MPFPVFAQVLRGPGQADMAAVAAALDAVQDLIHAGPPGEPAKLGGQELLQGLALAFCALLKGGMNVVGKVADEQVRHAYIMQACGWRCKPSVESRRHNTSGIAALPLVTAHAGLERPARPHLAQPRSCRFACLPLGAGHARPLPKPA